MTTPLIDRPLDWQMACVELRVWRASLIHGLDWQSNDDAEPFRTVADSFAIPGLCLFLAGCAR